jgi:hypothetical protein
MRMVPGHCSCAHTVNTHTHIHTHTHTHTYSMHACKLAGAMVNNFALLRLACVGKRFTPSRAAACVAASVRWAPPSALSPQPWRALCASKSKSNLLEPPADHAAAPTPPTLDNTIKLLYKKKKKCTPCARERTSQRYAAFYARFACSCLLFSASWHSVATRSTVQRCGGFAGLRSQRSCAAEHTRECAGACGLREQLLAKA